MTDGRIWLVGLLWAAAWGANVWLARRRGRGVRVLVPAVFGVTLVGLWELVVRLFDVPGVILPPPSEIWARGAASLGTLGADFVQTFLKGALGGYAIGALAAFGTALAVERWAFLRVGLLPVAGFAAALPIVGVAPIFVMWFGFDWPSKAAVVVAMVFFPVLVNAVAGLGAAGAADRDLMATYGASRRQALAKLRIPAAMPFVFNGLKVATTLALVGAIVAEFFGSPTVGMGYRISTEVGRMGLDMVWAEIAVAGLAGSAFYGAVALVERVVTFWHPGQRRRG